MGPIVWLSLAPHVAGKKRMHCQTGLFMIHVVI